MSKNSNGLKLKSNDNDGSKAIKIRVDFLRRRIPPIGFSFVTEPQNWSWIPRSDDRDVVVVVVSLQFVTTLVHLQQQPESPFQRCTSQRVGIQIIESSLQSKAIE